MKYFSLVDRQEILDALFEVQLKLENLGASVVISPCELPQGTSLALYVAADKEAVLAALATLVSGVDIAYSAPTRFLDNISVAVNLDAMRRAALH
jgi:hypothetical protein